MMKNQQTFSRMIKYFSYLGTIFILTGFYTLIINHWDNFDSFTKILSTLGVSLILYTIYIFCLFANFEKILIPLFVVSYFCESCGIPTFIDEVFYNAENSNNTNSLLVSRSDFTKNFIKQFEIYMLSTYLILITQYAITLFIRLRVELLFALTIQIVSLIFYICFKLNINFNLSYIAISIVMMYAAYYFNKYKYYSSAHFWYFSGSLTILIATFCLLFKHEVSNLYIIIAILMLYISILAQEKYILFNSGFAIIFYLIFEIRDYYNIIGGALFYILIGAILLTTGLCTNYLYNRCFTKTIAT